MSLDYEDRGPLSAIKDYAEFNDLDENDFYMIGTVDEAREKAKKRKEG